MNGGRRSHGQAPADGLLGSIRVGELQDLSDYQGNVKVPPSPAFII